KPARPGENGLLGSEPSVEPIDHLGIETDVIVRQRRGSLMDRLDGADAAKAAARGRKKIALPALVNARRRCGQPNLDNVLQVRMLAVRQSADGRDLASGPNDSFTEEKAQRQLMLVTGRPHHHGQRRAANSNFERLLRRQLVLDPGAGLLAVSEHPGAVRAAVAHDTDASELPPNGRRSCRQ